jgi:hypothetical protein
MDCIKSSNFADSLLLNLVKTIQFNGNNCYGSVTGTASGDGGRSAPSPPLLLSLQNRFLYSQIVRMTGTIWISPRDRLMTQAE